jgi:endonuclease YncB( thermonuclease family)
MRAFLISICFLIFPATVHAHGGGLNKEGCHNNRKTGDNHCHRGQKANLNNQTTPILAGITSIIDGGTIRIGSARFRLHGIDAPETKQSCTAGGKEWSCGWQAANTLANIVGAHSVTCSQSDIDRYGRIVAECRTGAIDLNEWMVGNGWAVAYKRFSLDYLREEGDARQARKGLWRGGFAMPWEWRRRKR